VDGHDRGMKMRAELVISAPAEDTWAVVGERFGEIGEWASPITRSAMDGPPAAGRVRTCHVAGFGPVPPGVIRERLLHFDPQARSLSYEAASGMPGFIRRAVSCWSVRQGPGEASTVRIRATVTLRPAARLLGPALRWRMRADTWAEVAQAGLAALRNTAADTGDDEALGLLQRAEAHARDFLAMPGPDTGSSPVTCPVFAFGGQIVRTISAVMRFDTACPGEPPAARRTAGVPAGGWRCGRRR